MAPPAEFTRVLRFHSMDLGKESTFVLTFDDKLPGIYKSIFPTAFRVTSFAETGPSGFTLTYTSQLGFTRAQVDSGVVQPAETYVHINVGQKTTLRGKGEPAVYSFSEPETIEPEIKKMQALNLTDDKQAIGIGFFNKEKPKDPPSQVLVFKEVGVEFTAQANFTPILRGYMTTEYQENAILEGQIIRPPVFDEDLVKLNKETDWDLTYNPSTSGYTLTQRKK